MAIFLEIKFISYEMNDEMWRDIGEMQWYFAAFFICEGIVTEMYMRHLDRVHFANNDLLKDQ